MLSWQIINLIFENLRKICSSESKRMFTAGAGGGLFDGPNIFTPKVQAYVLLPPRYGTQLGIETFRYYVTEWYSRDAETVDCTLLEKGEPVAGRRIQIPASVIESRKVRKGETYTQIGEYTYQYCLVRTSSSLQGSSAQELRYGQVVKVSWEQNTVWENVNAHSKLHVQLDSDQDVRVVKLADVIRCSLIGFLARPLEHASSSAFDTPDIQQLHEKIEQSIHTGTPVVFKEAFATSGRSTDEIQWETKRSIYSPLGTRESVVLHVAINDARKKASLIAWVILTPKPQVVVSDDKEDTESESTAPGLTAAQTAALVQQKCHEYFLHFNSWRQTIKTPQFLKVPAQHNAKKLPQFSLKSVFQSKSVPEEPKKPSNLWTRFKPSSTESLQP